MSGFDPKTYPIDFDEMERIATAVGDGHGRVSPAFIAPRDPKNPADVAECEARAELFANARPFILALVAQFRRLKSWSAQLRELDDLDAERLLESLAGRARWLRREETQRRLDEAQALDDLAQKIREGNGVWIGGAK